MNHLLTDEVVAVHGIITDTHPIDFYGLGVAGAIDRLTVPLRNRGVVVHFETPHHGMEVDSRSAMLLYRAAQELLSNIYKFANATAVTIRLAAVSHGIQLQVRDDGVGFNVKEATTGKHPGLGLRLMRSTVDLAGGRADIISTPGRGTCVTVTLPLD